MPDDFEFGAWSRLARTDPAGFERARRDVLEKAIARGNDPQRMRRMQWRLDAERRRARTPMKACLRLSNLMWEKLFALQDALNRAVGVAPTAGLGSSRRVRSAQLLAFQRDTWR
jgi:hypothetical protein